MRAEGALGWLSAVVGTADGQHGTLSLHQHVPALSHALWVKLAGGVQDSATARSLAFNKEVRTRCVTLEGDDFNPSGTLTGTPAPDPHVQHSPAATGFGVGSWGGTELVEPCSSLHP